MSKVLDLKGEKIRDDRRRDNRFLKFEKIRVIRGKKTLRTLRITLHSLRLCIYYINI